MAHLVLGYPTLLKSLETAEAYLAAGVAILELQIPFSHPTADGPVITAACREAVRQGVTVDDCIEAIRHLRRRFPEQEIMVMSYLNRLFAYGLNRFAGEMQALQVRHLIVPDLPVDQGVGFLNFERLQREDAQLKLVPVLAANVSDARLEKLLAMGFDFFYLMADFKITGSTFSLHPQLEEMIFNIKSYSPGKTKPRVGIGFGIASPEQAQLVTETADLAIIGSALIQAQEEGRLETYLESLQKAFAPATLAV